MSDVLIPASSKHCRAVIETFDLSDNWSGDKYEYEYEYEYEHKHKYEDEYEDEDKDKDKDEDEDKGSDLVI